MIGAEVDEQNALGGNLCSRRVRVHRAERCSSVHPPAAAPHKMNGSAPDKTASNTNVSADSCDMSLEQKKYVTNGLALLGYVVSYDTTQHWVSHRKGIDD